MSHLGNAGQLPLESYFAATLVDRQGLSTGQVSVAEVARRRGEIRARNRASAAVQRSIVTPPPFAFLATHSDQFDDFWYRNCIVLHCPEPGCLYLLSGCTTLVRRLFGRAIKVPVSKWNRYHLCPSR